MDRTACTKPQCLYKCAPLPLPTSSYWIHFLIPTPVVCKVLVKLICCSQQRMWELFISSVLKQNIVNKLVIHFHLLKIQTRGVAKVGHSSKNNGKVFPHFPFIWKATTVSGSVRVRGPN